MKCSRSAQIPVNWAEAKNPEAGCKGQIVKFVHGLRGPRAAPVSRNAIHTFLRQTPAAFVDACISNLVEEGKIQPDQQGSSRYRIAGQ